MCDLVEFTCCYGGRAVDRNARFSCRPALKTICSTDRCTSLISFASQPWVGTDVPLPVTDLKRLGPGNFWSVHIRMRCLKVAMLICMWHILSNRPALYHHLPQDCLTGSGWLPIDSRVTALSLSERHFISRQSVSDHARRRTSVSYVLVYWHMGTRKPVKLRWISI